MMNNLPPNWSWVKLGDVGEVVAGGTPSTKIPEYFDGKISWITPADLTGYRQKYISQGRKSISEEGLKNSSARIISKGSILFSSRAPIGYVAIASNELCTNQGFKNLIPNKKVDSEFVYYYLKSSKQLAEKNASGTTFKEISSTNFKQLPFPLPPLPEQKKIVEKIEELFSGLDSGVASLKKAKEQIRLYRQSVLASAFSGKLVRDEKRETKNELETHLNGVQGAAIAAEPKVGYGKDLPEGWKWVKTSDIMELIDNGYTPKAQLMYSGRGDIPFIKVYNLTFNGELDFSKNPIFIDQETHSKNLKRSITIPGDVLINIVGPPLGKVSIVPKTFKEWNINQAIVRFRPNKNITSKYLCYYLQNPKTIQWLESTSRATAGQYNIKVSTCREIPIPLISVKEQHQIVSEIEKRFSEVDNLEKAIDESLAKSDTLRQSILKQAFCGKLIINNEELIIKN